jgi:hypothetical protein
VDKVSIESVAKWAGSDVVKWNRLVGSTFVHVDFGGLILEEVDFLDDDRSLDNFIMENDHRMFFRKSVVKRFHHILTSQDICDEILESVGEQRLTRDQLFQDIIMRRDITRLYHFTRMENLPSIFQRGLLPRDGFPDVPMYVSDENRIDGRLDCVCVSISFPNSSMFYRKRKIEFPTSTWCVISIDPNVLWAYPCLFFPHNAATYRDVNRSTFRTLESFEALFNGDARPGGLPGSLPTNVQAEVQVEGSIALEMLAGLIFEDNEALTQFEMLGISLPKHVNLSRNIHFFDGRERVLRNR